MKFGGSDDNYTGFDAYEDDPLFGEVETPEANSDVLDQDSGGEPDEEEEYQDPLNNQDYLEQLAQTLNLSKTKFGGEEEEDEDEEPGEYEYQFKTQEELNTALETYFEERVGLPLSEAVKQLSTLVEWRNTSIIEQQQKELRQEWGDAYDENFQLVVERYKTLPKDMQYALDNAEGARLIYAQIEKERGARQAQRSNAAPPKFQRGTGSARSGSAYKFTQSEILAMVDTGQYDQRLAEINEAYQKGLVDLRN